MSCTFSNSEVYNKVNCMGSGGAVKCPFEDECNKTMMWDSINKYIRLGIRTYELAKSLKENDND